jgi:hypothetical protein
MIPILLGLDFFKDMSMNTPKEILQKQSIEDSKLELVIEDLLHLSSKIEESQKILVKKLSQLKTIIIISLSLAVTQIIVLGITITV